jgi:radical SAM/Cys-rich protein
MPDKVMKNTFAHFEPFAAVILRHGPALLRAETTTLQVNVGFLCNLACRHCHLEAGPAREEIMDAATARDVIAFARRNRFQTIDITGGAPELNPHIEALIEGLAAAAPHLLVRTNLTALDAAKWSRFIQLCTKHSAVVIASLPSLNPGQTDAQRGEGVFMRSIEALQALNASGYGEEGSGLALALVANPVGAFAPVAQATAEKRYRDVLMKQWGVSFSRLFSFGNAPLGRFRRWLTTTGQLDDYLARLAVRFNPDAMAGLMCRTAVSVNWDGFLYDCDFNIAASLPLGGKRMHVGEADVRSLAGAPVALADHCYACTAGAGFT